MAKVGEGDPRWIVQERQDGANVNAWHWQERDLSKYTHEQLKKAFADLAVADVEKDGHRISVSINELSDISGDVTVAQRKNKMMCYFELKMTLKWTGMVSSDKDDSGETVNGTMEINEVDHDELTNDYEIVVKCTENSKTAERVEDIIRGKGRETVRAVISKFFDGIFEEYQIGKQLKSCTVMPPPPPTSTAPSSSTSGSAGKDAASKPSSSTATTGSLPSSETSFSWKMRWRVPQGNLFNCFVDAGSASIYTRCPAKIDAKAGGQFAFLDGAISGYYVDVQGPTSIKQQWRLGSWPTGVHSSVVLQFVKEEPDVTLLEFAQSGIPDGQLRSVQEGWRVNFFESLRMVYGFSMEYI